MKKEIKTHSIYALHEKKYWIFLIEPKEKGSHN